MSHTPGPWAPGFHLPAGNMVRVCQQRTGMVLCELVAAGSNGKYDRDETEANGRLMAAAPVLKKACFLALKALCEIDRNGAKPAAVPYALLLILKDACEKSEPVSPAVTPDPSKSTGPGAGGTRA